MRVRADQLTDERVRDLRSLLARHPGDSPVFVHLASPKGETVLRLGDDHLVDASNGLHAELRMMFGADCIV
jgi:DNA polymerase-3 subunit alpha